LNNHHIFNESIINLFQSDIKMKLKYGNRVLELLRKTYEPIGGIKGSGFSNVDDMIKNIPLWKLAIKNNVVICCVMYKDKSGRKMVAIATDGSSESKVELKQILKNEFTRSYFEVSGPLLKYIFKTFDESFIHGFVLSPPHGADKSTDEEYTKRYPSLAKYFYQRKIGYVNITKIMLGTKNKTIIESFKTFFGL
jgi:hypothetical protein